MLKRLMCAGLVLLGPAPQTPAPKPATYVTQADIQATLALAPPTSVSDQPIRVMTTNGYNIGVAVVHRPGTANQGAILHDQVPEVYHIIEGSGMLVTGGTLLNQRVLAADSRIVREVNGPSTSGNGIQGGESRHVGPGDVVIIPAGVPHQFSSVEGTITYIVIRFDPNRTLRLK
jgi:mannose-6-phosphate isomerase-like protein (cupin superfamily)